jgi:hypothetical protein
LISTWKLQAHRVVIWTAAIAGIWVVLAARAYGVPGSPAASPTAICDVPARSPDGITALLAETGVATPAATTGGEILPEGLPADPEMAGAMEKVVQLWLACQNAGEQLRAWSLFSDGYLYRLLSRQEVLSGDANRERELATPAPAASEASTVLEIVGERHLPDGRYGATVIITYPSVPMPKRFFFYFTEVDDRLVIDGILGEISFSVP